MAERQEGISHSVLPPPFQEKPDPHFLDYLALLARYRIAVLLLTFGLGALFFAFTYVMPFTFTAKVTLLPPEKQEAQGLLAFLADAASSLNTMKSQENPSMDLFQNVLESRRFAEEVGKDPRIKRYYSSFDTTPLAITFAVMKSLKATPLRNGILEVFSEVKTHWNPTQEEKDSAQALSYYLANHYITVLDFFNRDRLISTAHATREFVEKEYFDRRAQLDSVTQAFEQFQEEHKAYAIPNQLKATVEATARLQAEAEQYRMQLALEKRELVQNSVRVKTLEAKVQEADQALARYENGADGVYTLGLKMLPDVGRTYAKFTRDIKFYEQLIIYLRTQWEEEKINERRSLPSLTVIDPAIKPDKKSSPKRLSMILLGLTVGFVLSMLYVGFRTYVRDVKSNPNEFVRLRNVWLLFRHGSKAEADLQPVPDQNPKAVLEH